MRNFLIGTAIAFGGCFLGVAGTIAWLTWYFRRWGRDF